jgi:iron complex transport system substrate-binding protein
MERTMSRHGGRMIMGAAVAAGVLGWGGGGSAQPVALTDMESRPVRLARPAERIASIPIPVASTIIAFDGSTRRLVGMNAIAKSAILEGVLGRIFPEARRIPSDIVGRNFMPNVEALAAVAPDLVIQWGGRGDDIVRPLTNAGLTMMLILYGREQQTREYHRLIATAMDRAGRAEDNEAWRIRVQADMEARVASIAPERRPRVLHLSGALTTLAVAGTGNYIVDHVIGVAGGRNAAELAGIAMPVNREQIAAWNPDVITLNSFEPAVTIDFVLNDPILSLTNAARSGRVYKWPMGGYRWDPPSQESPLAWMWLGNLLHPDVFAYDLRAEMRAAYQDLYGYRPSDTDLDDILWIAMQGRSANYVQFRAR